MSPHPRAVAAALFFASIATANTGYIDRRALWNGKLGNGEGVSFGINPGGGTFAGSFGGGGELPFSFPGMSAGGSIPTGLPAGILPSSIPKPAEVPKPAETPKPVEVPKPAETPKPEVPKPAITTPVIPIPARPTSGVGAGAGAGAGAGSGASVGAGMPSIASLLPIPTIPGGGAGTSRPTMVPIPKIPGQEGTGAQGGQGGQVPGGADPNPIVGENGIIPTVASGVGPNGVAEGLVLGGYYGEYNPLSWFNGRANTFGNANYVIYPPYNICKYNDQLNYGKAARVRIAHAVLAAATFVFILPVGGIAIRILPGPIGVAVHVLFQLLGYTLFVAAVGMGIWMALYIRCEGFFMLTWYHQIIGLIIFGLISLQPFTGLLHHVSFRKRGRRSFISFLHTWNGRLVITLGMINGGLGLLMAANAKKRFVIAYAVIAAGMWTIYITIGILGEIRLIFKRKPKTKKSRRGRDRSLSRDSHVAPPAPHYAEFDADMEQESTDVNTDETSSETDLEPARRTSTSTVESWEAAKELRTYGYA